MGAIITIISMLAAVIGIIAIVPQVVCMLKTRSSAGQSSVGWLMGLSTNAAMAFVNFVGYHATVLVVGNVLSLAGCVLALSLVAKYKNSDTDVYPIDPAFIPHADVVGSMHTTEFTALSHAVIEEHARRSGKNVQLVHA